VAAESTHYDILVAVAAAIKALALEGVPANQVVVRKAPYGADLQKPALVVWPGGREDFRGPASNSDAREVGYPVAVTYVPASPQESGLTAKELAWRAAIVKRFEDGPAVKIADQEWPAQVEPGDIIDAQLFQTTGWFVGTVLLRFWGMQDRQGA
jgi:UDP:flavonoid glycosyltransferase YjiC (YdhE family)